MWKTLENGVHWVQAAVNSILQPPGRQSPDNMLLGKTQKMAGALHLCSYPKEESVSTCIYNVWSTYYMNLCWFQWYPALGVNSAFFMALQPRSGFLSQKSWATRYKLCQRRDCRAATTSISWKIMSGVNRSQNGSDTGNSILRLKIEKHAYKKLGALLILLWSTTNALFLRLFFFAKDVCHSSSIYLSSMAVFAYSTF